MQQICGQTVKILQTERGERSTNSKILWTSYMEAPKGCLEVAPMHMSCAPRIKICLVIFRYPVLDILTMMKLQSQ